ncbi:hypothetical protein [Flavobacterium sp. CAN_S2]|uniref:hypothetical protein n=1 Tax=Flavobacterium sp. CAN_S2 TaxID=2787726 RepID=UPI0018CB62A1
MKKQQLFFLLLLHIIGLNFANAQKLSDNAAIEIVNKSIDAMGGQKLLQSIKTLYTDSETEMQGRKVNWIVKEMLPNKGSFQIIYQGRTVYQNWFNGKIGYELNNGEKKLADQEEFKDKKYKQNIFNELDYINPSLYRLEFIGEEKIESNNCNKIKATLTNGLVKILYYDKNTFLLTKTEKILNAEKNSFSTTYYSNYKKFNDLTYFTEMKFGEKENIQIATIIKLLYNENITEKDFE